jgi:hypothetical protein
MIKARFDLGQPRFGRDEALVVQPQGIPVIFQFVRQAVYKGV